MIMLTEETVKLVIGELKRMQSFTDSQRLRAVTDRLVKESDLDFNPEDRQFGCPHYLNVIDGRHPCCDPDGKVCTHTVKQL